MITQMTDNARKADNVFEWTREVRDDGTLSPAARHAALTLATFADPDGSRIRPSLHRLADGMGKSRASAADAVAELVETGWLARLTRPGRPTVYVPTVPSDAPVPVQPAGHLPPLPVQPAGHLPPLPVQPAGHHPSSPLDTTSSVPRQYGDGDAREDPDPDPDDDGWGEVDPEVQAFDIIGQAVCFLGGSPAEFRNNRDHPAFDALLDQITAELRDGGDGSAIFARLTQRPAPASVESWAGLLRHRLGTQTAPVPS